MKQIKLEVGKIYRSREGEEVKILRKNNKGWAYWEGSNGCWYTESGKYSHVAEEHPKDLIEEVPEPCHTFSLVPGAHTTARYIYPIPEGAKKVIVSQEANRIIVEMVPEEAKEPKPVDVKFKEGDIVFEDGRIMIIEKYPNLYRALIHGSPDRLHVNGSYGIPFTSEAFRLATPEEAQLLFDALKKAGKRWNPKTMQVEDVPEIDRIREWVEENLNDVYYSKQCIAKVIGYYLKYKEGKNKSTCSIQRLHWRM